MDFTLAIYQELLTCLEKEGYAFQTFHEFYLNPKEKSIVLRHDVDSCPSNSLTFAKIQAERGIKGVYYFRAVSQSWNEEVICKIAALGHEIGYHYESLTTCRGHFDKAIQDFEFNLKRLRKLAPVSTICMHGSPMSKYDSRDLWKKFSYRDYKLIAEPYFDIDYNQMLYLTDTGRKWNGSDVSVRDKVQSRFTFNIRSTQELIKEVQKGNLPKQIMFTFHPQRWSDSIFFWVRELVFQNCKNIIKKLFFVR